MVNANLKKALSTEAVKTMAKVNGLTVEAVNAQIKAGNEKAISQFTKLILAGLEHFAPA